MPELPEVETLCRQLQGKIIGKKIRAGEVYDEKLSAIKHVNMGKVLHVERQGKTIVIKMDNRHAIKIHLRMTGRLLWSETLERPKHGRWRISFDDGNVYLIDTRRFATVKGETTKNEKMNNDLITNFDEKLFMMKQASRKVNVKALIMDPKAVAGIGNIYACEILHRSGISPFRMASNVSRQEWKKIFSSAKRILKKGIEKRGTSISDWQDLYGCRGENQYELKVYRQAGKSCSICGGRISRIKQGGRSTFYCPACQK